MNIYVGRWDLLPAEWDLSEKSEEEIAHEMAREVIEDADKHPYRGEDDFISVYTPEEFEETFNQCLTHFITSQTHWIKIF